MDERNEKILNERAEFILAAMKIFKRCEFNGKWYHINDELKMIFDYAESHSKSQIAWMLVVRNDDAYQELENEIFWLFHEESSSRQTWING